MATVILANSLYVGMWLAGSPLPLETMVALFGVLAVWAWHEEYGR